MKALPLRLLPGMDLRKALESIVTARNCRAAFVVAGIGSLRDVRLRLAGANEAKTFEGDLEILTIAGSVSGGGSHLHMTVANAEGSVFGGHVAYGCAIRTTAEVLLALFSEWSFTRELDPTTGYAELVIRSEL